MSTSNFTLFAACSVFFIGFTMPSAFAQKLMSFNSVEQYSRNSIGIWIIEVDKTSDQNLEYGMIYNVKVIQNLKGEENGRNLSIIVPFRKLYPGERCLVFGFNKPYLTPNLSNIWMDNGSVSPVKIPGSFSLATLQGTSLKQKIETIMRARIYEVDDNLKQLVDEKKLLYDGLESH